ncbi:acetate uptake transporter [Methanorbis rubei]|uniref:Succinate-acetate/proton symporter SatP n=1 Tax=Methanorbis rubei TaxID=3028300 RepID=A0AAE4ME27_9EURY|nr:Succinate-acetate/proton symporter SatP [Methanocorpusculaceae archaeon Cs1]
MTESISTNVAKTINPAPIGLFGFAFTTIMLSLCNIGVFEMNTVIIGLAFLFGGLAQFLAGLLEWRGGNIFGMVVFTSFGMFWLVFALSAVLPAMGLGESATPVAMGCHLVLWAIFTATVALAATGKGIVLPVTLWLVCAVFICLAAADFTGLMSVKVFGGFLGVVAGACAYYIGTADLINGIHGCKKLKL